MTAKDATNINPLTVLLVPLAASGLVGLKLAHVISIDNVAVLVVAVVLLVATIFSAVHHAEVIALKVGEPFGSLILAVAVTVIEVALIVTIMMATADGGGSEVARDTVFAAMMIVLTGIIGVCVLVGAIYHREQNFHAKGATAALSVLTTLAVLALILPKFTVSVPGPYYATSQLIAVGIMSLGLYLFFLFVQSVRHREYFLDAAVAADEGEHVRIPTIAIATSLVMLVISLTSVVLIAKSLSPKVESAIVSAGLPLSFVGVVIASVILLPEAIAAFRAARQNRMQQSLNLALGSVLAGIGLTIPTVALASILLDIPLGLGLNDEHTLLLVLALFITALTTLSGRTNILQGGVHLVIFAAFLIMSAVP
ncbi:MAG: ionic transporter y4hA [Acuticoccus sp.]